MFNDQLLKSLTLFLRKIQINVSFYWLFNSKLVFKHINTRTFVWKSANYADAYWFQLDAKSTNLDYQNLPKFK